MLSEAQEVDKIEVVGPYNIIQVRTATVISRDGVEISRAFHRTTVVPGQSLSGQDPKVVAIANAVHTPEVVAAYEAYIAGLNGG
jgi:hypothetical protein